MYNFDEVINRRNTDSLKWDVEEHELPMWVADMDFQTAPEIRAAIQKKVDLGIFGYSILPDEWAKAYKNWWERRHGFTFEEQDIIFTTGVVPAISTAVRKLTTPAEKVVIQTPVYNIFFNSIINNGRYVVECPLVYDGTEFQMDFGALEQALSDPQVSLMILCNPQNPAGKIWSKETLAKVGELCKRYHVTVVSDEIHCDLTDPETEYVPFATASDVCREISVTCIAPTKTFNIAGLQTAAVVVPNEALRHKMWRALNTDEVAEPNVFAVSAAIAAFEHGEPWLEELRKYIYENKQYVIDVCQRELSGVSVVKSDATYLLWMDCGKLLENLSHTQNACANTDELAKKIRQTTGLYVSAGLQFGKNSGNFIRLNIACPKATLMDGMERFKNAIHKLLTD